MNLNTNELLTMSMVKEFDEWRNENFMDKQVRDSLNNDMLSVSVKDGKFNVIIYGLDKSNAESFIRLLRKLVK